MTWCPQTWQILWEPQDRGPSNSLPSRFYKCYVLFWYYTAFKIFKCFNVLKAPVLCLLNLAIADFETGSLVWLRLASDLCSPSLTFQVSGYTPVMYLCYLYILNVCNYIVFNLLFFSLPLLFSFSLLLVFFLPLSVSNFMFYSKLVLPVTFIMPIMIIVFTLLLL